MKTFLFVFLIMISAISSCRKDGKISKGCPQDLIDMIKEEPVRNPPSKVMKWTINNKIYYYIPPYCCDAMSQLYDDQCHLICAPDGGFSGGGDGRCPSFGIPFDSIPKEIIWEDTRK